MQYPTVSILVPVYNVESYVGDLFRQLEHLCRLVPDIELIFVEDKSTDRSLQFLEDLMGEAGLPNARLITHEENRGLGAARNTGLDQATGAYVWCVDSDDLISVAHAAELLQGLDEASADCVLFDFLKFEDVEAPRVSVGALGAQADTPDPFRVVGHVQRSLPANETITEREKALVPFLLDGQFFSWSMIVRRSIIGATRFPEGMLFEDHAVSPRLILAAKTFKYVPLPIMLYRVREGSIMKERSFKSALDVGQAMFLSLPAFEEAAAHLTQAERDAFGSCLLRAMYWQLTRLVDQNEVSKRQGRESLRRSVNQFRRFAGARSGEALLLIRQKQRATLKKLVSQPSAYLAYRSAAEFGRRARSSTSRASAAASHQVRRLIYVVPPRLKPALKKMLPAAVFRQLEQRWRKLLYKSEEI